MKHADQPKDPSADIFEMAFARRFLSEMADRYNDEIDAFQNKNYLKGECCDFYATGLAVRPCAAPEDEADAKDSKI